MKTSEELILSITDCDSFDDATYKDESVTLNKPFSTPDQSKKFGVYARNQNNDVVMVRFDDVYTGHSSKDPSTPAFWTAKFKKEDLFTDFKHVVVFDSASKTIVSVRDGVQEYMGVELGVEPSDKIFTVYRSPETISAIAGMMDKLPIINDHIDPTIDPTANQTIGVIGNTEVVEYIEESTDSTLSLINGVSVNDSVLELKANGKKQFSLGYLGKMREHGKYDFEQFDIDPRHLALVDAARGGSVLTFIDKRKPVMDKVFLDENGSVNLQRVVEIATALPEAIKTVPLDQLQKLIPSLEAVVASGKESDESMDYPSEDMDKDMESDGDIPAKDMESDGMEYEKDMPTEDMDPDEDEDKPKNFGDSKKFKDALAVGINAGIKAHSAASEKARDFLSETYSFGDKSVVKIMRDALATQTDEKFTDSELPTAFKMLRKSNQYAAFGDSANALQSLAEKEL